MFPPLQDVYRMAPELVACLFGMLIMVVEPFLSREHKEVTSNLGLLGSLAALASVLLMARHPGAAMHGLLFVDRFNVFMHLVIFGAAALVMLMSDDYLKREGILQGEFFALVLFATCGMGVMAGGTELITMFVGLEISSISSYILACYRRAALKSHESAMKYFLLGSFATAFFLYGIAFVYGLTGTLHFDRPGLRQRHGRLQLRHVVVAEPREERHERVERGLLSAADRGPRGTSRARGASPPAGT